MYWDLRDKKISWDDEISDLSKIKFKKQLEDFTTNKKEIPKVIPLTKVSVTTIDLHDFGDISIAANCVAVLATVYQSTKANQSL